jgi:hypothetical protein
MFAELKLTNPIAESTAKMVAATSSSIMVNPAAEAVV